MANRAELKALLARAGVEINNSLHRVDHMPPAELAKFDQRKGALQAFFDTNGVCGRPSAADLAAFFDTNGVCTGRLAGLETAFKNVLKVNR